MTSMLFGHSRDRLEQRVEILEEGYKEIRDQLQQFDATVQERLDNDLKLERKVVMEEHERRTEAVSVELWAQVEAFRADIVAQLENGITQVRAELDGLEQGFNVSLKSQSDMLDLRLQQVSTLSKDVSSLRLKLDIEQDNVSAKMAEQAVDVDRIREALSGDGGKLLRFLDEERQHEGNFHVDGTSAEWLVRDIKAWLRTVPNGQALESPVFTVEVPGLGRLDSLRLRFFPNGGKDATNTSNCSLYLAHPERMPWAQYELTVGSARRGVFDPIYVGSDDFCALESEFADIDGVAAVRLGVHFLPPAGHNAIEQPSPWKAPQVRDSAASPSPAQAPQTGGLWLSSNRLEAGYG